MSYAHWPVVHCDCHCPEQHEHLAVHALDPDPRYVSPIAEVRPSCTYCGDELFPGETRDPRTGRCAQCVGRDGSALGFLGVVLALVVLAIVAVAVGYATAPRSASDPTVDRPGAPESASRPGGAGSSGGDVAQGGAPSAQAPIDTSGPVPSGAPSSAASGAPFHPPAAVLETASEGGPVPLTTPMPGALRKGFATYCADTGRLCRGWNTRWVGAVHSFHDGDAPYGVQVCRVDKPTVCTHVVVVSYCACGPRHGEPTLIDLSPPAFRELAPLSRGIVRVTVQKVGIELPATDSEEDIP